MTCLHWEETVRVVGINGDSFLFERCSTCLERLSEFLPHNGHDIDRIPIVEDRRLEVPPCRRCGARGAELHHWAPRALFEDAEVWPQDWLCRVCHTRWHQTMDSHVRATASERS